MSKPRVYVDMDGVLCDYMDMSRRYRKRTPENAFPQASYGFFRDMIPMEGAVEAYGWLHENFDTWILTRPSVLNPMCYTEKREWVERHLGIEVCEKLIMCTEKGLLKGDYLIDDMPWPSFEGQQITFGSEEFKNWTMTLDFFQVKRVELDFPDCEYRRYGVLDGDGGMFIGAMKDGHEIARIKMR